MEAAGLAAHRADPELAFLLPEQSLLMRAGNSGVAGVPPHHSFGVTLRPREMLARAFIHRTPYQVASYGALPASISAASTPAHFFSRKMPPQAGALFWRWWESNQYFINIKYTAKIKKMVEKFEIYILYNYGY
jgi:hypothetical protein